MAKKPCDCDSGKMTFQQWAAAGGAVPTSYKGREKAWANQVKKYAAGGSVSPAAQIDGDEFVEAAKAYGLGTDNDTLNKIVARVNRGESVREAAKAVAQSRSSGEAKMQAGGIAKLAKMLKGTQEVLPAAQRDANLQKMLEPSKIKERLYHGTTATEGGKGKEAIRRFKPSKEGALGSGTYLTPNPNFAGEYAPKSGGNMLPVYAQMKNPLIIEGKGDPMIEALIKLGMNESAAGRMVENAYERKGYIGKEVESRARAAGYDGLMQYRDGNLTEVVSYNPNAIKSATGNVGTYDVTSPDMSKAGGGAVHMQAGGIAKLAKSLTGAKKAVKSAVNVDEPAAAVKKIEAPTVIVPGKIANLKEVVRKNMGDYGARRVERAADEIKNLERMYQDQALREVFIGDNAQAMVTMRPADFEKYAVTLKGRTQDDIGPKMAELAKQGEITKYTVPTDEYIQHLMRVQSGFDQVPYLNLFKDEVGIPTKPQIKGHEGRHRSRALAQQGEESSLVRIDPRGDLREGLPRRSQEEYIEALREELERSGRLVLPEIDGSYRRPAIEMPEPYAGGGEVKMADGGKADKPYIGYRRAGRRPESQQDRAASANIPVAVARGLVSGTLGMPGDLESLARLPYELITGKESPTILPTSGDIEKRLPFRGASQTPVGQMFTGASQLAGGAYTGPLSGARAVMAVPKAIKRAGQDFVQAAGQPAVNVIKPKGGNWFGTSVEDAMAGFKNPTTAGETASQRIAKFEELLRDPSLTPQNVETATRLLNEEKQRAALDNWVDRNLTNYVKKEMATPEDPVRRLAEQGVVHIPSQEVGINRYRAPDQRRRYKGEQLGQSEAARAWEDASDVAINAPRVDEINSAGFISRNPWVEKLPPDQRIYGLNRPASYQQEIKGLGFDHILDVLKQDLASGRIRPDQLNKVSMEQAVRRTYDFDQDMAKKMREAQIKATEGMPVHKEYPEGYKWIELAKPNAPENWMQPANLEAVKIKPNSWAIRDKDADKYISTGFDSPEKAVEHMKSIQGEKALEAALKYEGDTMGHCVGGYCPDVLEGKSRIYSLRDAKGEPHVTVEVKPMPQRDLNMSGPQYDRMLEEYSAAVGRGEVDPNKFDAKSWHLAQGETRPPRIVQIKGKQNRAPNEEYLPFVQDFVRGGKWSDVGDFQNTGLRDMNRYEPLRKYLEAKGAKFDRYIPEEEFLKYEDDFLMDRLYPKDDPGYAPLSEGMKAGGEVKMAAGGIAKLKSLLGGGAKPAKVDHPLVFPRAEPKTREEIRPIAQRVAEQMTGEFVRQNPKVTTNPAGKSRKQFERERNIPLETRNVVPEKNVPPMDYEKLKDYAIVGVPGDPSMGGVARAGSFDDRAKATVELTRVGDITPDSPVPLFGGPRYGDDEKFWASNLGAATPIQSNVTALGELYDAPVLGKYIKMAPDSANFAMHNLDSLLAIQRPEQLSKGKLEQLNRLIRKGSPKYGKFPGFSGFDDPLDVLLQSQLNSDLRKHIAETLTKPTITQALGLPNGQDVVAAITHPELRNLETGVSGFSIGRMVPGATLKKGESAHPTYDTDIPGQLIGRSKYPTPYEIAFPDTTAYARSQLKPGVQEFNMMKLLGPRERIDQQYVDEMKTFEELMKQYTGKKKGGAVKSGLSSIKKV